MVKDGSIGLSVDCVHVSPNVPVVAGAQPAAHGSWMVHMPVSAAGAAPVVVVEHVRPAQGNVAGTVCVASLAQPCQQFTAGTRRFQAW